MKQVSYKEMTEIIVDALYFIIFIIIAMLAIFVRV